MTETLLTREPVSAARVKPAAGAGVLRNLAYMITSSGVIRVGSFFFSIFIRRILGPQLIGVWNVIEIIRTYLIALTLGVHYSSERLIPYHQGRGEHEAVGDIKNSLFTWSIIEGVLLSAGVFLYITLFGDRHSAEVRAGLYFLAPLFFIQKLLSIYSIVQRSNKAFRFYSTSNVVLSALDWSLLAWAFLWGLPGLFAGAVVTALVKLAYLQFAGRRSKMFSFRWQFKPTSLRRHLPYGPKYSLFKITWTIMERLDSLLVGYLLGSGALACYYLGFQFSQAVLDIPIALVYIAFPNLMETYSRTKTDSSQSTFFWYLRINLFLILPVILPLGYFGSELLIRWILPEFVAGVSAVKITMMAVGILAVRHLYYRQLMVHEEMNKLIMASLVYFPALAAWYFILKQWEWPPLITLALANFAAYTVHLGCAAWSARKSTRSKSERWLSLWWLPLLVCLTWAALLAAVDGVMPEIAAANLAVDLAVLLASSLLYLGLALPLVYFGLGQDRGKIGSSFLHALHSIKRRSRLDFSR